MSAIDWAVRSAEQDPERALVQALPTCWIVTVVPTDWVLQPWYKHKRNPDDIRDRKGLHSLEHGGGKQRRAVRGVLAH